MNRRYTNSHVSIEGFRPDRNSPLAWCLAAASAWAGRLRHKSREHWVCVPVRSAEKNVRPFGTFTADLDALADWLQECGVKTVAMEATRVY